MPSKISHSAAASSGYDSKNLESTGNRRWKYRLITAPLADLLAQEEILNRFAGYGYRMVSGFAQKEKGLMCYRMERRTRKPANNCCR
jgi:hypothetical protein